MKNLKKLFAVVIAVAMMVTAMAPAFAAGAFSYEAEAQVLNDLGLYKGISETEFVPDLGTALNRETGVVMLLRIFGLEADAEAIADADAVLAKFKDAASISSWAKKAVAYAVENGLVQGLPDGTFAPKAALNGKAYSTLILRQLGYTPDYNNAPAELADKGGLTVLEAVKFTSKELVKDDLVGISYGALKAEYSDGATVIEKLIEANPDMEEVATTAGLVEELTITSLASVPAVKVKVGATADLAKTVTATYSDKTTAEVAVTWDAVDTTKAGTVTVAGTVEGTELKASVTVTVEAVLLAVDSVTAINNKKVAITFNMALDSTSAVDEANYEVKDKGANGITLGASSASLSDDKKTVTLNLNNAATDKLTNSSNAKVTVKKTLKGADGVTLAAEYVNEAVKVYDGVAPEAVSVKATGVSTIELTMSEPVYDGTDLAFTSANFEVKGGSFTYFVSNAVAVDNVITLTLGTNMQNGNVTITFNKNAEIMDYAGIKAFQGSIALVYAKDTEAPVVSVKEFSQTSVTLQFNKPVNATGLKLFHSVNGVANYGNTQNIAAAKEVTFSFPVNKLPEGTVKLFVVNSSTSGQEVTDLFGNKMADTTLTVQVTIDNTPPTVAETKLNTNVSYDITFSENIDTAEAKAANFTVKKVSDGKDKAFTVTNDAAKKVTLNFTLDDNTDYEITVKSMKDVAGNTMASSVSYVVNAGDNTSPEVAASGVYSTDAKTIYIVFNEPMNQTDMLNKAMYVVDNDGVGAGAAGVALDSDDTLTAVSDKKVKLVFNDAGVSANTDVVLGAMRDLAGKPLYSATTFSTKADVALDTLQIDKAELIAKNKIKVTFTKELSVFDNSEFELRDANDGSALDSAVTISSVESMTTNSDGKSEVVIVLSKDLPADGKYETNGVEFSTLAAGLPATPDTKSVEGTAISADTNNDVADKVAPTITSVIFNSATSILVNFDEDIRANTVAAAGANGFSVSAGSITDATLTSARKITIVGSDFTNGTAVTYTAGNITDDHATGATKLATVTKNAGQLVATAASTPNATVTLALSEVDETYSEVVAQALWSNVPAAQLATLGDFTVAVSGVAGANDAAGADALTVASATTGVFTFALTDADNDTNGNTVTATITHVPTGAVETVTLTFSTGNVVKVTVP